MQDQPNSTDNLGLQQASGSFVAMQSGMPEPIAMPPQPMAMPVMTTIPEQPIMNDPTVPENMPAPMFDQPLPVDGANIAGLAGNDEVNSLADIKKQALMMLEPLVDSLEQTPEDHFKTVMMLIQTSDKPELIAKAYRAAQAIGDNGVKAQALLDVVNEVNYFTQK
jgi:hypothetical protein